MAIGGFSISPNPGRIGIKTYRVPGAPGVSIPVRSEVAPLLIGFAAEFHRKVEPLHAGWCWGYAFRAIRDRLVPSFHSGGLAIDLNAPKHGLGSNPSRSFSPRQIATIRALCRKYGLRWGGDYRGRKDPMHVEVILPRAQAIALAQRLQAPVAPRLMGSKTYPVLRRGSQGSAVADVQRALVAAGNRSLKVDGDFGPGTEALVRKFQANRSIPADGVVGPKTWIELRKVAHS